MRFTSDKQREDAGVRTNTDYAVYISPLELLAKLGTTTFPQNVMTSYNGLKVTFLGLECDVTNIYQIEPVVINNVDYSMAIKLELSARKNKNNS